MFWILLIIFDVVDSYFSKTEIEYLKSFKLFLIEAENRSFHNSNSKGLSFPLDTFSVSIDSDNEANYMKLYGTPIKKTWNIVPFETLPNYKAAIAVKMANAKIKIFNFKNVFQ